MSARILLIDDDDIVRELLSSLLLGAGHQVWELPSPIGATRTILNERIEIVILDIFMPLMDGDKSAKMLRENPRLRDLGIILVSSCEEERLQKLAERVGADAIVSKSEVRTRLIQVVGRVRSRRLSRSIFPRTPA
jgi:CheY-like chemotaxis protein